MKRTTLTPVPLCPACDRDLRRTAGRGAGGGLRWYTCQCGRRSSWFFGRPWPVWIPQKETT